MVSEGRPRSESAYAMIAETKGACSSADTIVFSPVLSQIENTVPCLPAVGE